jgi:Holliday junction resolvasome RuvABC endonuclease subunit
MGKVLMAIDPGTSESAFVVMDTEDYRIVDKGKIENDALMALIKTGYFDMMAIEAMQSFGMGVGQSVFETAYFIGALMQAAKDLGSKVYRVYRTDVKMHHCHTTRAKDGNIRQALIDRFGEPGTKKAQGKTYGISKDIWSALAIAVFWIDTHKQSICNSNATQEG